MWTEHVANLQQAAAEVRCAAAESLAQLGSDAQPAALALLRACVDEVEEVREWAVAALEGLGPPPRPDLPALLERLHDPSPDVSFWAATLIGRLGGDAADARSELQRVHDATPHDSVRQRTAWALKRVR